jgi:putative transcriptional regulator
MVVPKKAPVYRRRPRAELHRKSLEIGRLQQSRSRAKGSRVGNDLVEAFEEMAKHLRGEIELEAYNPPVRAGEHTRADTRSGASSSSTRSTTQR